MNIKFHTLTALLITLLLPLSTSVVAGKHHHKKPPQIAIDACEDLSENATCEFIGRRGNSLTGQCIIPPKNENILVCKPNRKKHHHKNKDTNKDTNKDNSN